MKNLLYLCISLCLLSCGKQKWSMQCLKIAAPVSKKEVLYNLDLDAIDYANALRDRDARMITRFRHPKMVAAHGGYEKYTKEVEDEIAPFKVRGTAMESVKLYGPDLVRYADNETHAVFRQMIKYCVGKNCQESFKYVIAITSDGVNWSFTNYTSEADMRLIIPGFNKEDYSSRRR